MILHLRPCQTKPETDWQNAIQSLKPFSGQEILPAAVRQQQRPFSVGKSSEGLVDRTSFM